MEERCLKVLEDAAVSREFWVRVHAVEFLAELGYTEKAAKLIRDSLSAYETVPQKRIGFWRSLYRVESDSSRKKQLQDNIANAYLDRQGADRVHAAETLSKLGYSLKNLDPALTSADLARGGALGSYMYWGLSLPAGSAEAFDYDLLWKALTSPDEAFCTAAAYALTFSDSLPLLRWRSLKEIALAQPENSPARPYLLGAAYALPPENLTVEEQESLATLKEKLLSYSSAESKAGRIELCRALARRPDKTDLPVLQSLLELRQPLKDLPELPGVGPTDVHPWNTDVQAAAAYAILQLKRHQNTK